MIDLNDQKKFKNKNKKIGLRYFSGSVEFEIINTCINILTAGPTLPAVSGS